MAKTKSVPADLKECTLLFHFFFPFFLHHIVSNATVFSDNQLQKEAVILAARPLIQRSRLRQHQEPLKASEQLLVSCNGLPLPDVVGLTLRPQRQFASWPPLTQLIHQPHFQSTWVTLGEPQRTRNTSLHYYTAPRRSLSRRNSH